MFNLEATLFCGQTFVWQKDESSYRGVINHRLVTLDVNEPFSKIVSDPFLRHYFDLEYPYEEAETHLAALDPALGALLNSHRSIHILNQDPWETTLSFITSQNNTIRRIRNLLNALRATYGKEVAPNHHALPTANELLSGSTEDRLRALGFGYRAEYLLGAARNVELLARVEDQEDEEALRALQQIHGIGPKVASCILLFAYGRKDIFPLDTWTRRILSEYYPEEDPSFFSPYGGIAQQHLFYAERRKIGLHW
ncbi:MAG: DNA glycosylase [Spirochaetota bacterium]|jgi:N-glycosylase/DNA lyase|nr:DNA glycosylase [Spirochaetota bacterium]NLK13775.1 DNA lyase [Spirochaetales bacterium]